MPPGMPGSVGIDLANFNKLSAAGSITIQRLGPKTFQMLMRQYDSTNGQELPPAVIPVNPEGLQTSIENTQQQIDQLEAALQSLNEAKAEMERMEAAGESISNPVGAAQSA